MRCLLPLHRCPATSGQLPCTSGQGKACCTGHCSATEPARVCLMEGEALKCSKKEKKGVGKLEEVIVEK